MAPPLYFLPKTTIAELAPAGRLDHRVVARFGLDRTMADVRAIETDAALFELVGAGPGGLPGCLFCALPSSGAAPPRVLYAPGGQQWQQVSCGGDPFWVSADKDHPPRAEDLVRRKTLGGYRIEMADQIWVVPVIRTPDGGHGNLPCHWEYDEHGKIVERLKAEYEDLWERFGSAVGMFAQEGGQLEMDRTEAADLCVAALAINYRVGPVEQNLLHLIDSETWAGVLAAAVDYLAFRDLFPAAEQKKTAETSAATAAATGPESTDTSPGSPACCPATDPAG